MKVKLLICFIALSLLLTAPLFVVIEQAFAFLPGVNTDRKNSKDYQIVTVHSPGKAETDSFDCREKIYLEVKNLPQSHYVLEASWVNPKEKQQEYTKYEFTGNYVWLWLNLHPATGGKLFGGIDPSAGMGDFIGRWKVSLFLNDKFLGEKVSIKL